MLLTQAIGQPLHRLFTLGLPTFARLALGNTHVLHHLLQLAQCLFRLGHAALLHQLLNPVHHALQVVLRHLHGLALLTLLLVAVFAFLRLLALQLAHIVVGGAAQLFHQLCDLGVRGAVLHRLLQTLLCAAHPVQRIGQHAFLQLNRQVPQIIRDVGLHLVGQTIAGANFDPFNQPPQAQRRRVRAEYILRTIGDRPQDLREGVGVALGPQQITPLFNDGRRQRIEKASSRQGHLRRRGGRLLFRGIQHAQRDGDRQIGPRMFGEIVDQVLFEIAAVPGNGQRQRHDHLGPRVRVNRQPIAAVHSGQIEIDPRLARFNAIVVPRHKGQLHLAKGGHLGRACNLDLRFGVGQHRHVPRPPVRPVDGDLSALADFEIPHDGGGVPFWTGLARDGLGHRQRPHFAIHAQGDQRARRQVQRPFGKIGQIQRRLAGIARRLGPAFPDRTGGQSPAARRQTRNRPDAQHRPKDQRRNESQQRDIA